MVKEGWVSPLFYVEVSPLFYVEVRCHWDLQVAHSCRESSGFLSTMLPMELYGMSQGEFHGDAGLLVCDMLEAGSAV